MALNLHLGKNEFWSKEIADNDEKDNEIYVICPKEIMIGNAWDLYNVLDGDSILNKIIDKNKGKEKEKKEEKGDELEIKTDTDINTEEKKINENPDNIPQEEKEEEEEAEDRDDF